MFLPWHRAAIVSDYNPLLILHATHYVLNKSLSLVMYTPIDLRIKMPSEYQFKSVIETM